MIVVAIIAILASIAYPTYTSYVTKARRNAASACLSEYANYMERYYTTNLRYDQDTSGTANTLTAGMLDCSSDSQTGTYYSYSFAKAPPLSQSAYKILATPQGVQATRDTTCGVLGIDQSGQRYYQSTLTDTAGLATCWQH
jgi:type IV pilus assembly protein PilE